MDRGAWWATVHGVQCRRPGFDHWVGKIPWRSKWQPTPVSLHGKSHGQRSLVVCSPWSRKELATTEQLIHTHTLLKDSRLPVIKNKKRERERERETTYIKQEGLGEKKM